MNESKIQWTDVTWNPLRGEKGKWHCTKVSPGCDNCYAEAMNIRFGGPAYDRGKDKIVLDEKALEEPLRWKKARMVFVCSMTDIFHPLVQDRMLERIFSTIRAATDKGHTFQILTKRSCRLKDFVNGHDWMGENENLWFGVTAENQEQADKRARNLMETRASLRFLSVEPMLEPIRLPLVIRQCSSCEKPDEYMGPNVFGRGWETRTTYCNNCGWSMGTHGAIHWVIVGGESGTKARPCDVAWVGHCAKQCQDAGVPVFVKQLGAKVRTHVKTPTGLKPKETKLNHPKGGDPEEWPENLRIREYPLSAPIVLPISTTPHGGSEDVVDREKPEAEAEN